MAEGQRKLKKGGVGQEQAARVMKEFAAGKLRNVHGSIVTDPEVAKAIAMSEGRAAEKRGIKKRMFKGKTRMRPRLASHGVPK